LVGSQAAVGDDVVLVEDAIGEVVFDGAELSDAGVLEDVVLNGVVLEDATIDAD
jgi:hypothetical protein